MSFNLSRIQEDYVQRFPSQVPFKAAQGVLATVAISLLFGASINSALFGGSLAAAATVVEAVIRPGVIELLPEAPVITRIITAIFSIIITLNFARLISPWIGMSYRGIPGEFNFLTRAAVMFGVNYKSFEKNIGRVFVL